MFRKVPNPQFRVRVDVSTGEGGTMPLDLECNRVGRKEFNALFTDIKESGSSEAAVLGRLINSWDYESPGSLVDEPYTPEALERLLDECWSFGGDFIAAYVKARAAREEAQQKN